MIFKEPLTFKNVMLSIDSIFWKEEVNNEIEYLKTNGTWYLCDLPFGCKWIFKQKLRYDGIINKFKTRLVEKGFTQRGCIKYFDMYSPLNRITTIRIHQIDVKA